MGGERASTTRQRERGQICCFCGVWLERPAVDVSIKHPPTRITPQGERSGLPQRAATAGTGERVCFWCEANAPIYRVMANFMLAGADGTEHWYITFLERDAKTPVGRPISLRTSELVFELLRRGNAEINTHDCDDFDHAIEIGRGSIWLNLTRRQYLRLR